MRERKEYMDLALLAVETGKKAGADGVEAFISDAKSVQVSVSSRQVEQVNAVREAGIGVSLLKDQKMISGSTNELGSNTSAALPFRSQPSRSGEAADNPSPTGGSVKPKVGPARRAGPQGVSVWREVPANSRNLIFTL